MIWEAQSATYVYIQDTKVDFSVLFSMPCIKRQSFIWECRGHAGHICQDINKWRVLNLPVSPVFWDQPEGWAYYLNTHYQNAAYFFILWHDNTVMYNCPWPQISVGRMQRYTIAWYTVVYSITPKKLDQLAVCEPFKKNCVAMRKMKICFCVVKDL